MKTLKLLKRINSLGKPQYNPKRASRLCVAERKNPLATLEPPPPPGLVIVFYIFKHTESKSFSAFLFLKLKTYIIVYTCKKNCLRIMISMSVKSWGGGGG